MYDNYVTLLWSVASTYDKSILPSDPTAGRLVNIHIQGDNATYEYEQNNQTVFDDYNDGIGYYSDTYEINQS